MKIKNNIEQNYLKLKPATLAFASDDPGLEKEFAEEYFNNSKKQIRWGFFIAILIVLFSFYLDTLLIPEMDFEIWLFDIILFGSLILGLTSSFLSIFKKNWRAIISAQIIVIGVVIILNSSFMPNDLNYYFLVSLVFTIVFSFNYIRARYLWATLDCSFIILFYIVYTLLFDDLDISIFISNVFFLFITLVLGIYSSYNTEKQIRKNFLTTRLIKSEQKKVLELNRELEEGVKSRTKDLEVVNDDMKMEIVARKLIEEEVKQLNQDLEQRVISRTEQLQKALDELKNEILIREHTEEELKITQDELVGAFENEKRLNALKSRIISSVSHEFRTPLTIIMSSSYLMETFYANQTEDKFTKHNTLIQSSVINMTKIIENTIAIEKSNKEFVEGLIVTKVDFKHLVEQKVKEFKNNNRKEQLFEIFCNSDNCFIETDSHYLNQIITNLISNAVKFSDNGSLIKLELIDNSNTVCFSVIDQGIGIPEDDIADLFMPFHRASNVGAVAGAGLGLSIIKRCTNTLKGKINLKSELDKGSTFEIVIPKSFDDKSDD